MRAYTYRRKDGGLGARATADNPKTRADEFKVSRAAAEALEADGRGLFDGPIAVRIDVRLARPKSVPAKRRPLPTVKPDADKIARLVLDALTKIVFVDDAAVCCLQVRKRYAAVPYVLVRVAEELPD